MHLNESFEKSKLLEMSVLNRSLAYQKCLERKIDNGHTPGNILTFLVTCWNKPIDRVVSYKPSLVLCL